MNSIVCNNFFRGYFDFSDVLTDVESASAKILFAFDGETTGIRSIENGQTTFGAYGESQLTIDNDAPMYNLAGQKVGKNYKGIVIQNGVKRILK